MLRKISTISSSRTPALVGVLRYLLTALLAVSLHAQQDVFPYPYEITDLDNGLRVVTVSTEFPGIVSVHCVVSVGSRHEVEEGKTGFAHFFEHMMFRGTETMTSEEQAAAFKAMGADRNAYTSDDITNYHTVVPTSELERVLQLEADRFQNLSYSDKAFRTEAMAILGEYNKNAANPISRLLEKLRETAFDEHTYAHTTMGYLRDIHAMPRQIAYSKQFFDRFYRPEYTTVLVVGDVAHEHVTKLVAKHWGDWERGDYVPEIPEEPEQTAPRTCHVDWPSPTKPWVVVAYKIPAFSTEGTDLASLQLASEIAFGRNSDLYRQLFVEERKVDNFFAWFPDRADPTLGMVFARLEDPAEWAAVRDRILGAVERLREEPVDADELRAVKMRQRYAFAAALDSSDAIAGELASYVSLARTPQALEAAYDLYDAVTPQTIRTAAREHLVPAHRTIATLSHEPLPESEPERAASGTAEASVDDLEHTVFLPSSSPLLAIRVVFPTGAADDPEGMEGLANLTARVLTESGTAQRSYAELVEAFYPMATAVSASVDKEMTVLQSVVHRDNAERWLELFAEVLTEPGFGDADFERVRSNALSALQVDLKQNDDEELGKEVLYREVYGEDHDYGHPNLGTVAGLESIDLSDVRQHYTSALGATAPQAIVGVAGDADRTFVRALRDVVDGLAAKAAAAGERSAALLTDQPIRPVDVPRNRMTIVAKNTRATGLHVGFPIEVTRGHPDWVALWLVRSYFGEHRSENSYLYQRLREIRGLNYGDYAYIEYFPQGGRRTKPPTNVARRSQIFQVWIRPVPPENGPFALKATWYELDKLVRDGMTEAAFEATRAFLSRSVALMVQNDARRLGYTIDSRWYGTDDFVDYVRDGLAELTLDDVNRAIREHLRSDRLQYVVVTEDAEGFRDAILGDEPTPIVYRTKPDQEILDEDAVIERLELDLSADTVEIVPLEQVFAK